MLIWHVVEPQPRGCESAAALPPVSGVLYPLQNDPSTANALTVATPALDADADVTYTVVVSDVYGVAQGWGGGDS